MVEEDQVTNTGLVCLVAVPSLEEQGQLDILVVVIMPTITNTEPLKVAVDHLDIIHLVEVLVVWRVLYVSGTLDNYVKRLH
tara:strand:- start:1012 stop:1254 length:243 start_codon:yes stop_codon:yes gene_type:complete